MEAKYLLDKGRRIQYHRRRILIEEPAYDLVDSLKSEMSLETLYRRINSIRERRRLVEQTINFLEDHRCKDLMYQLRFSIQEIKSGRCRIGRIRVKEINNECAEEDEIELQNLRKLDAEWVSLAMDLESEIRLECDRLEIPSEPFLILRKNVVLHPVAPEGDNNECSS